MLLTLPPAVTEPTNDLLNLRAEHELLGARLANAEYAAAAHVATSVWGDAARLAVHIDLNDDGDTSCEILLVFGSDGELLWFNTDSNYHDCRYYPGADAISDDRGNAADSVARDVLSTLQDHLERGYLAAGEKATGALLDSEDDFFGPGEGAFELVIAAAI